MQPDVKLGEKFQVIICKVSQPVFLFPFKAYRDAQFILISLPGNTEVF